MVQDCSQRWDRLILSLWLRGFANVYAIQLYVCIANEALIYVDFGMHPAGLVVSKVVTRIQETFQGASHFINWLIISLAQQITCHESHRSGRVVHVSPHGSALLSISTQPLPDLARLPDGQLKHWNGHGETPFPTSKSIDSITGYMTWLSTPYFTTWCSKCDIARLYNSIWHSYL